MILRMHRFPGHSGQYSQHPRSEKSNSNTTLDLPDVPTWVLVLSVLLLSFGIIAVVMVFCKFLAPSAVYISQWVAGYSRLRRDSVDEPLSPRKDDEILDDQDPFRSDSLSSGKSDGAGWLDRLVNKLVFFTADDANETSLVLPVSDTEKLGSVEI
jgi:hypothetical protein